MRMTMAWLWRKKKGEITSWDDLRDAPGYDMVPVSYTHLTLPTILRV